MLDIFDVGNWCDICGDSIPPSDERIMYIEGCEKTLCKKCSRQAEKRLKVLSVHVIHDVLRELTKQFGIKKVREFDLITAERFVTNNNVSLNIEKRGGKFNQERLGEFVSLSTGELIIIIKFLKRKINPNLWMNAVIGSVLDRQMTITLVKEGQENA
ncbi:hypothetical protein CON65_15800 [Bacillus pseudomycoides]|uniref:Uncharacterized protein n=1 Tax=Bacillus pseudomycoides TaxID=64104 RepID=A0AA91VAR0_9BACI|nr:MULTISPECIES: hypothetical protein [Bacillus]PEB56222.1 hypothetical protein COO03_01235 [Bacillus sp. AFS098217]PED81652.1 hypothetical protein CON65_15800 [Bacillus pseudomycoides]